MARASTAGELPLPPDEAWRLMADLSRFGDWLSIHGGWVGELPDLAEGAQLTEKLVALGIASTVAWTIDRYEPPHALELSGTGLGGAQIGFTMAVHPAADRCRVEVDVDLDGPLMAGPIGAAVEQNVNTELSKSLLRLSELAQGEMS